MRRLLVEETFNIRGRGVVVAPFLDAGEARREKFAVEFRKPNGETVRVMAFAQIPFITPTPPTPQTHLTLLGVSKEDVPIGTEVLDPPEP